METMEAERVVETWPVARRSLQVPSQVHLQESQTLPACMTDQAVKQNHPSAPKHPLWWKDFEVIGYIQFSEIYFAFFK